MMAVLTFVGLALIGAAEAAPSKTAHAHHGSLVLSLTVSQKGGTVFAKATLLNQGRRAFTYYGACAPPIVQIQARNAAGHHVYGWQPPSINCTALSRLRLSSRSHLSVRAKFTISVRTTVYAVVPSGPSGTLFSTRAVTVNPR